MLNQRLAIALILGVSALAVAFLFWLLYFHQPTPATNQAVSFLPAVNATCNALSATCLVLGFAMVKRGRVDLHRLCMLSAFAVSSVFLVGYIVYHQMHGDTRFLAQGPIRMVYFPLLISHVGLSIVALPMVLMTFYLALTGQVHTHRRLARFTLPIWLYVSVTGVLVFAFLKFFN